MMATVVITNIGSIYFVFENFFWQVIPQAWKREVTLLTTSWVKKERPMKDFFFFLTFRVARYTIRISGGIWCPY